VNTGFSLQDGPFLRVTLVQLEADKHLLLLTLHHIIADGWSAMILTREMLALYNAYCKGQADPLPPLRVQYRDYAAWQRASLQGALLEAHRNFWKETLGGELPVASLPLDFPRPAVRTFGGDRLELVLDADLTSRLSALGKRDGTGSFILVLSLVKLLLNRYSGQCDIIVGTDAAGRDHKELETQIGVFLNTVAIRSRIDAGAPFEQLLTQVKDNTLTALEHAAYPFEWIMDDLNTRRDLGRFPLFDVFVISQNTALENSRPAQPDELAVETYPLPQHTSKFDLSFLLNDAGETMRLTLEYNSTLFVRETIEELAANFHHLATLVAHDSSIPVANLSLLPPRKNQEIIRAFTAPVEDFDF
jgi:hypothetical protein